MQPILAIYLLWAIWVVTWFAASLWVGSTVKRASAWPELLYRAIIVVGFVLLSGFYINRYDIVYRFWRTPTGVLGWLMVVLVVAGLGISWWARGHLGPLWSGTIARKNDHRIVDTGPYALVRHPIYAGLMLSAFATAVVQGTPTSFLGAVMMILSYYSKARLEERFLREELGPDAYNAYEECVPMLVPYLNRISAAKSL